MGPFLFRFRSSFMLWGRRAVLFDRLLNLWSRLRPAHYTLRELSL